MAALGVGPPEEWIVVSPPISTLAPSKPGTPSGVSNTTDSIDLTWSASTDNVSSAITYRIYRDGGAVPIGSVTSSSTTTVGFTDSSLVSGSIHTYTVDAQDAVPNTSQMSATSEPITVQTPDTEPPTQPGTPAGVANGKTKIDLSWAASTDDKSADITYHVYRDGDGTPIGSVTSSSTTTVSFTDVGLDPGSTHTYAVDARDEADNVSPWSDTSDPITTLGNVFADAFDTGDLSAWTTSTGLTIDNANGGASPPSALGSVSGSPAWAARNLSSTYTDLCVSFAVNVTSQGGTAVDLMRMRTAANGSLAKVYRGADGVLYVRNDVGSTQRSSNTMLATSGWHTVELCGTNIGAAGTWDLYLDGSRIVNGWAANTGSNPVGRIQIGDTGNKTWTINVDDVVVDQVAG